MSISKRFFLLGSILLMAALFFTFTPNAPQAPMRQQPVHLLTLSL